MNHICKACNNLSSLFPLPNLSQSDVFPLTEIRSDGLTIDYLEYIDVKNKTHVVRWVRQWLPTSDPQVTPIQKLHCVGQFIINPDLARPLAANSNAHNYLSKALRVTNEECIFKLKIPRADSSPNSKISEQPVVAYTLKGLEIIVEYPLIATRKHYQHWIKSFVIPLLHNCPPVRFNSRHSLHFNKGKHKRKHVGTTTSLKIENDSKSNDSDGTGNKSVANNYSHLLIYPAKITNNMHSWKIVPPIELCVDFETVGGLNDNFINFPCATDNTLITMIGCAYDIPNSLVEEKFVLSVNRLTMPEEELMIDSWFYKIDLIRQTYHIPLEQEIRVWCWSKVEVRFFETDYNSAINRHGRGDSEKQGNIKYYDILDVIKAEPVVIHGALNFGLKSMAKALKKLGKIEHDWPESQVDNGLNAMVAFWVCDKEAQKRQCSMKDLPMWETIRDYNLIDVLAMKSTIQYLRNYHT